MSRDPVRHAAAVLLCLPNPSRDLDPAERALRAEAKDTARMALCFARGVALEDIDPVHGYDLSRAAYDRSRKSWWRLVADDGGEIRGWVAEHMATARADWLRRRPEYVQPGDWPGDNEH